MKFEGYERSNGSVGVRNHVLILSASNCANQLASIISDIASFHWWRNSGTLPEPSGIRRLASDGASDKDSEQPGGKKRN